MPSTDVQIQGLYALFYNQITVMHACLLGYNLKSAPQFETSLCPNVLTVVIYTNDVNETKENNKLQAHAEAFDLI